MTVPTHVLCVEEDESYETIDHASSKRPSSTWTTGGLDQRRETTIPLRHEGKALNEFEIQQIKLGQPKLIQAAKTNRNSSNVDAIWQDFRLIPHTKPPLKVFTLAPVQDGRWSKDQYQRRFDFIKVQLKDQVDKHLNLHETERCPTFHLHMVGESPPTAEPYIVVICNIGHLKELRQLLDRFRKPLHLINESILDRVRGRFSSAPPGSSIVPELKMVYEAIQGATVSRTASKELVEVCLGPNGLCGGLVRNRGASATLGVSIDIDSWTATLTVNHLFQPAAATSTAQPLSRQHSSQDEASATQPAPPAETLPATAFESWEDDVEYDEESIEMALKENAHSSSLPTRNAGENTLPDHEAEAWERIHPPLRVPQGETSLDWALVRPASEGPQKEIRGNRVRTDNGEKTLELHKVRRDPPVHLTPVFLVSGVRGIVCGRILAQSSFIPTFSGGGYFEAWTVILDDKRGLLSGESGSVVINKKTDEVYGYVVGCSPFGHAYVVCLTQVLQQIQACFGAHRVVLSNPSLSTTQTTTAIDSRDTAEEQSVFATPSTPMRRWRVSGGSPFIPNLHPTLPYLTVLGRGYSTLHQTPGLPRSLTTVWADNSGVRSPPVSRLEIAGGAGSRSHLGPSYGFSSRDVTVSDSAVSATSVYSAISSSTGGRNHRNNTRAAVQEALSRSSLDAFQCFLVSGTPSGRSAQSALRLVSDFERRFRDRGYLA